MKKASFQGLIQVYTGNGKGKTTAALGLALRAVGHRFRVLMIQFLKGGIAYGELKSARKLSPYLTIVPMGRECFVDKKNPHPIDRRWAQKGWKLAQESVQSQKYQLVILDEINVAVEYGLVPLKELLALMKNKPENVELSSYRKMGQAGGPPTGGPRHGDERDQALLPEGDRKPDRNGKVTNTARREA